MTTNPQGPEVDRSDFFDGFDGCSDTIDGSRLVGAQGETSSAEARCA
jgi:hypothetical protein